MNRMIEAGRMVMKYSGVTYAWPCRKVLASVPKARVTELKLAAMRRASQTITGTATGLSVMWPDDPPGPGIEIWVSVTNMEPMAATAATRLMDVIAPILPNSPWLRGAGVKRRLSKVLRSRSPAELSRAAEKPPVRIMVMRMYGRKKLRKALE